ncbi:MAG: hypothetical protein ACR2HM_00375 [Acidimicrobiales bacterium]
MVATGSDPARSGATAVGRSDAGHSPPALPRPAESPLAELPPTTGGAAPPSKDWAAEAADAIEGLVATVRDKTVGPLETVGRALVYGLLAAIVGLAAAVLATIAVVRGLNLALPGDVWVAHATAGGIFTLGGLLFWKKRTVKTVKV